MPSDHDGDAWRVKAQEAFEFEQEHCTLTILEHAADALVKFELLKLRSGQTVVVTCAHKQFDEICSEHAGLSGAAQTGAAIRQLFREVGEVLEEQELDAFGEDDGAHGSKAPLAKASGDEDGWCVKSQEGLKLGKEHCTLTILEHAADGLVRFEALPLSTGKVLTVTCTHQQFDDVCKEQAGLVGAAQTRAAVLQLFREAGELLEEEELDAFGEESSELPAFRDDVGSTANIGDDGWRVKSQEAFTLDDEYCTLTILEHAADALVKFEAMKLATSETLTLTCTHQQFQEVCDEQLGLSGAAQTSAAVRQLFREAKETLAEQK
eukprot:TRINITY_DN6408_c0_g1_i14.p1 TRINITY_DN6408_c0_g1~~TRINITY_DN6408_c0_g1_i14.p1  ORF type:complete len:322 (+),score=71.53 TRINITY_DN6408_c0_g1_i14:1797-2762(+)